ncbi:hypothetical protein KBC03_03585 [Patescibacteria group bacterium]|nr:hypothetical protein [Patescibacteria group bacterium]
MLFANISTDKIHCIVDGNETIIEHGNLEKTIADFLYAQKDITNALIINGPGSFTNLRIATLGFNLYNFLHKLTTNFYTIDKLTLYKKLYQRNVIPRTGYIYIGQKRNRRKIDLENMHYEMTQDLSDENAFVDEVFEHEQKEGMVRFGWQDENLMITYKNKITELSLSDLELEPIKVLEANYMMEPNVTMRPETTK